MNTNRPIIAVGQDGKPQEFATIDAFAKTIGLSSQAVAEALEEGKDCGGWKIYETPENYRDKIANMKNRQVEAENLMKRIRLQNIGL